MDQYRAPIYEALLEKRNQHISLHVPGHKLGHDFDEAAKDVFSSILSIDQTEIDGLDDLHHPSGAILEAERLAAAVFGSEETKFLVGGTTVGILSLLLATLNEGDYCIIERTSHKSVYNGLRMSRAKAIVLPPNIDPSTGVPCGVRVEQVTEAIQTNANIKAIVLTCPNYYGMTADIASIVELAHRYSIPVIVDEAHGAHFPFSDRLPRSALSQGADAVVQSTHKTLSSMTMSSMLHLQGSRIDRHRVKKWLSTLQSSSPSYPLLASLDLARRHMAVGSGKRRLEEAIDHVYTLRAQLSKFSWFILANTDDPLRLVMLLSQKNIPLLIDHLKKYHIYPELIEPGRLVFVFSGGNISTDFTQFYECLTAFQSADEKPFLPSTFKSMAVWHNEMEYSMMENQEVAWCPLDQAIGRVSASMIVPYPPGIPFILEGQRLTNDMIMECIEMLQAGIHIHGVENNQILVYKE